MSLTGRLEHRGDPLREFFENRLPSVRFLQDEWRSVGPPTIVPTAPVTWGLVGAALDYRLRYLFAITPTRRFVAALGAALAGPPLSESFAAIAAGLDALLDAHDPRRTTLPDAVETHLLRYCYLLAMYESLVRASGANSPLRELPPGAKAPEQLALVPTTDLADLAALAEAAVPVFTPLLGQAVSLNPTFDGSVDVGGADADLIVGGCLIDFKTTKKRGLDRETIYQLLGYPLLDYSDSHKITRVGLYSSRVPHLFTWPLDELVNRASGARETVASLRTDLQSLLGQDSGRRRSKVDDAELAEMAELAKLLAETGSDN